MNGRMRIIALCVVALLSIGGASASAASAAPHWTVEGKAFGGTEALNKSVLLENFGTEKTPKITVNIRGYDKIACTGLSTSGSISENSATTGLSFSFSGCTVLNSFGQSQAACSVHAPGPSENGKFSTFGLTGKLETIEGRTFLLTNPQSGSIWAEFVVAGSECGLNGTYRLVGNVALEVKTGTTAAYLPAEGSQAIATAAHTKLLWGSREAFVESKMGLALASGKSWGVGL